MEEKDIVIIQNKETKKTWKPKTNEPPYSCCSFYSEYEIPCSHMLMVNRRSNDFIQRTLKQVNQRWLKTGPQTPAVDPQLNQRCSWKNMSQMSTGDTQIARYSMLNAHANRFFDDASTFFSSMLTNAVNF
jgi:hypothetical protein